MERNLYDGWEREREGGEDVFGRETKTVKTVKEIGATLDNWHWTGKKKTRKIAGGYRLCYQIQEREIGGLLRGERDTCRIAVRFCYYIY